MNMASGMEHIQRRAGASVIAGAVLLLASMVMQWSFGPAYMWRLHQAREHMKALILGGLPEGQMTMLHFPASAVEYIEWRDGGCEVNISGEQFDIIAVEHLPDGAVMIRAVRDDLESQVRASLDRDVRFHLAQDARGKEYGSRFISAWAEYCEQFMLLNILIPPMRDREYGKGSHRSQRVPATVDPDPPRMS